MPLFKNMSKKMKDSLNEEQKKQRDEVLHVLCMNLALCHLKRNNVKDALKFATESLEYSKTNPKAYYRLALAQKLNGEFDLAKESLVEAIKLAPNDKNLREEYAKLQDQKKAKEKEWFNKMSGFYHSEKMQKINEKDQEEAILKEKLNKKLFLN